MHEPNFEQPHMTKAERRFWETCIVALIAGFTLWFVISFLAADDIDSEPGPEYVVLPKGVEGPPPCPPGYDRPEATRYAVRCTREDIPSAK